MGTRTVTNIVNIMIGRQGDAVGGELMMARLSVMGRSEVTEYNIHISGGELRRLINSREGK